MKRFGYLGAGLAVLALASCNPTVEAPGADDAPLEKASITSDGAIAPFMALVETPFSQAGASETDLEPLIAALPAYAALDWDTKSFVAETGATVFTGLSFSLGEGDTKFGVRFDEASVWGLETDLLTARLNGQRLSEAGPLFTRLDGTNLTYFGIDTALTALFEGMLERFDAEMPSDFEFGFDDFDMSARRVVVTDAALQPWELVKAPASLVSSLDETEQEGVLEAVHFGQHLIAISRSMSYGNTVMFDVLGAIKMRQPGTNVDMDMSWEMYAYSGVNGFDVDKMVIKKSHVKQVSDYSELGQDYPETGFPAGFSLAQETTTELTVGEGLKLNKVMGFLARSELPDMNQRDLLSLGRWQVSDYVAKLNDRTVFSVERARVEADQFDWLIPTSIGYELDQATINISEITWFGKAMFETFTDGADLDNEADRAEYDLIKEGIDNALDLLPQHGLDTITFDADMQANWNSNSGLTDFSLSSNAEGFGEGVFDFALDLPIYAQIQTAFEAEDKEAAFEAAFEQAFSFRGLRMMERDGGGYDKILGFAQAIGKEYPDQGWGAMLGNMDPPQMRSYIATMIRMAKAEAGREFPQATDWMESYATFIESGGAIELKFDPPKSVDMALLDSIDDDPEPDEIVDIFGISVTHTK